MEKKKLSTAEILAAARAQAAGKADAPASEPAEQASAAAPEKAAPAPAGGAPKSTKDILAAARAQAAAGGQAPKPAAPASAATPGGAPKSTKDILAAARAQAAGGAAAPAAESKPATKSTAAAAAAKPAGDRPSVQDMLKAVREGKAVSPEVAAAAAKPQLPPTPQRPPVPVKKAAAPEPTRRNVLVAFLMAPFSSAFATAWTLLATATGAFTLALARFMMPNVLVEPPSKFKVGPPSDYPLGMVSTKWTAQFAVWIVHTVYNGKNVIYALSTVCTHLGCTPNWLESEQKYKCPCHGSGFYPNGINFEGPAPRPLERFAIRLAEDGMLEVDRSRKFQQEMGQWEDTSSFVEVA